jgi:predicted RNA-binding Zn ribbon-like protein
MPEPTPPVVVEHRFEPHDLVAGHPVLDLINTVTARDTAPRDWLHDPGSLLRWAALCGAFDAGEIAALRHLAAQSPRKASASLTRLKVLREALHRVFVASTKGVRAEAHDLAVVDRARVLATRRARLVARGSSYRVHVTVESSGLDTIADRLVMQATELLSTLPSPRLRVCEGRHCGWLFADSSRAGRRRWCDMATCGTAQKYERVRRQRTADAGE